MTVKVFTDYGINTYDNANKYRVDDEGVLWVDNAATFNRGVWTHVELENVEPKKEPRVWDSLFDIPKGVSIRDRDGDLWTEKHVDDKKANPNPRRWGPYTEVLS